MNLPGPTATELTGLIASLSVMSGGYYGKNLGTSPKFSEITYTPTIRAAANEPRMDDGF